MDDEKLPVQVRQETLQIDGSQLLDLVKRLIHEGNVRRIIVKQGERVVAEFPLMIGVAGAILAPALAGLGAIAALLTDCTLVVERVDETPQLKDVEHEE